MPSTDADTLLPLFSRLGDVAARMGLRRTTAQIYAFLLLSSEPRSLDDIADTLGISKASVSTYARELASLGAVRKVWAPETRRDLYEAEGDLVKVLRLWLQSGAARRLAEIGAALGEVEAYLARRPPGDPVRARIASARALHANAERLLGYVPVVLGGGGGFAALLKTLGLGGRRGAPAKEAEGAR